MISAWIFAPRARRLELFEHQESRTLADHESVALGVVGARRESGCVVAAAAGVQRVESLGLRGAQFLRAAGQHARLQAMLNGFEGVADGLAARGAGAVGGDHASLDAEEDADIRRGGVRHHADVRIRVDLAAIAVDQHLREIQQVCRAADARAAGHSHLPIGEQLAANQTRVAERELGAAHRELRHAAHAAQLFAGPGVGNVEGVAGRGQARAHVDVPLPLGHVTHTAAVGAKRALDLVPRVAERRDAAHAGDHHAPHQHSPPLTPITWRVT